MNTFKSLCECIELTTEFKILGIVNVIRLLLISNFIAEVFYRISYRTCSLSVLVLIEQHGIVCCLSIEHCLQSIDVSLECINLWLILLFYRSVAVCKLCNKLVVCSGEFVNLSLYSSLSLCCCCLIVKGCQFRLHLTNLCLKSDKCLTSFLCRCIDNILLLVKDWKAFIVNLT